MKKRVTNLEEWEVLAEAVSLSKVDLVRCAAWLRKETKGEAVRTLQMEGRLRVCIKKEAKVLLNYWHKVRSDRSAPRKEISKLFVKLNATTPVFKAIRKSTHVPT